MSSSLRTHRAVQTATLFAGLIAGLPALAHDADDPHQHDNHHHGADHHQIDGVRFDVHSNMDQNGMAGLGARIEFAIVPDGFLGGNVHDELALSFGADVMIAPFVPRYYDAGPYVLPIGAVQWNFYLDDNWSVFPELGVAAHVGFRHNDWRGERWIHPWPDAGFGVRYHFNRRLGLLMRISTPGGFQFGMIF